MLIVGREDVSRLRHEVDAAKHDVLGLGFSGLLAEHERITEEIGVHDDAVALVVVAQDEQVLAEFLLQLLNAVGNRLFFHGQRGVHEVDRTHREGDRHVAHASQPSILFEGTDGRERSKTKAE